MNRHERNVEPHHRLDHQINTIIDCELTIPRYLSKMARGVALRLCPRPFDVSPAGTPAGQLS